MNWRDLWLSTLIVYRQADYPPFAICFDSYSANVGPWKNLAASHTPPLPVYTWTPSSVSQTNPYAVSYNSSLSSLLALITPRTRIVALSGCSNLLGEMLDIETAVKAVRGRKRELTPGDDDSGKLWIVIDLVAFAPHRCVNVRQWDVDFAVFSFYKACPLKLPTPLPLSTYEEHN